MDEIYKGKTREEIIQLVYDLTLQNTNGRETNEEMYKKGIEACYDELVDKIRFRYGDIHLHAVIRNPCKTCGGLRSVQDTDGVFKVCEECCLPL